jgi:hypothetical protein
MASSELQQEHPEKNNQVKEGHGQLRAAAGASRKTETRKHGNRNTFLTVITVPYRNTPYNTVQVRSV